jgi:hypothetical protein
MQSTKDFLGSIDWGKTLEIIGALGPLVPVPGAALIGQAGAIAGALITEASARQGKDALAVLEGVGVKADAVEVKALMRIAEIKAQQEGSPDSFDTQPLNETGEG